MKARFLHEGKAIDYTPQENIPAGSVVVISELIGITHRDIAAGQLGTLNLNGVYEIVKEVGSSTGIAAGNRIFWNQTTQVASKTSVGIYMGKAVQAAGDNGAIVLVKLDQ